MKIELKPELEALIKQDVERGAYKSADEFVEQAVSLLHEQEAWLAEKGTCVHHRRIRQTCTMPTRPPMIVQERCATVRRRLQQSSR